MRATCGVMSARRPIMRPESWSTTLKVRSSRSCPVPVSSESTYSSSGGITNSYLFKKNKSRTRRRSASMRIASAGRMSSMNSGRSHFTLAAHPQENQQADEHRRQSDEADLPVAHLDDPAENVAPEVRREEGKQALENQHQGERQNKGGAHASSSALVLPH